MSESPTKIERPLSPHLQIYKMQITAVSSILHRLAGIALIAGLFFMLCGLLSLAGGRESFESFTAFCSSILGQVLLFAWSAAFYYHMCTGLRHFILDSGFLFEKGVASASGYVVILISSVFTGLTWAFIYKDMLIGGAS